MYKGAFCDGNRSNEICKVCIDDYFLYNSMCIQICPDGYYADIETNLCEKCDIKC